MANNYCESSSFIPVPTDKIEQAKQIVTRICDELENDPDEGYVGFEAEIEKEGVWIHADESISPEHVELLVSALVDELDLPGIHVCSWSYTCSKPRIDEFGGGAFAVQKGRDTVWVDAAYEARRVASLPPNAESEVSPSTDLLAACDALEISGRAVADIMHRKGEQDDPILSERLSELWQACNVARAAISAANNKAEL